MPHVFINYRTGDGEAIAALLDRELVRRLGKDRVFYASRSIEGGTTFGPAILAAVRSCSVLIPVIGTRWLDPKKPGGPSPLADPKDWTRQEIHEAFDRGVPVVPVLVDKTPRLAPDQLPADIAELAEKQYRRLDHRNIEPGVNQLVDTIVAVAPELKAHLASDEPTAPPIQIRETHRRGGVGNIVGNVHNLITDPTGPVHTGTGDQHFRAPRRGGEPR